MSAWLPDSVVRHLRDVAAEPDFSGTRYTLIGRLGRGGMGAVYAARDEHLGRRVALKVVASPDPASDRALLEEARIIAALEHPGIVPLYDAGTLGDGRLYYAMKLVEGERLDAWARRGDVPLSDRLRLFQKICDAVAFAHAHHVVHRDLKPANIMAGSFGEVLILDWGVARAPHHPPEQPGTVVGTPEFMAPELAAGGAAQAGPEADIYSLGVILRVLLPPGASRRLLAVAARASSAVASERYDSASALQREIARYLDGEAVEAYRESTWERATRFGRRNQTLLLLLGAYALVRFFLFFWSRR